MSKCNKYFMCILAEAALFFMNYLTGGSDNIFKMVFAIIVAVAFWKIPSIHDSPKMEVFFSVKAKILFCLLDFYTSFALIGHNAFLKNVSFEITVRGVSAYGLCIFIMYPVLIFMTYSLIVLREVVWERREKGCDGNAVAVQIKCFLMIAIVLLVISFGYYPAVMTPDGVYQWIVATGIGGWTLGDSHPAIHTLFLRLCSKIAETPYTVVLVQILLFALLWSTILKYIYQQGKINKIIIYGISLALALFPNNYMMLVLVSKNIVYAMIVVCTTFLFIRLYADEDFLSYGMIVFFGADLTLLWIVRHNGFVGAVMACILLILLALYKVVKKEIKKGIKMMLIVVVMVAGIHIIKGPVYDYFEVVRTSGASSAVNSPLSQAAAMFYLADENIPEEVKGTVDKIGTKEQWLQFYNPYDGDKLDFSELREALGETDKKDMLVLYFTLFRKDPLLVMKARLNANDLAWNVVEPTENYLKYDAKNNKCSGTMWPGSEQYVEMLPGLLKEEYKQENGGYANPNFITAICDSINKISYSNDVLNSIFWRNGIYVIIMFWLFVVNYLIGSVKVILAGLPALAILGSLVLVASWQIYQYYWFFPMCVLLLLFVSVMGNRVSVEGL